VGRITPNNRRETAEAWALGLAGGLFALKELGSELGREASSTGISRAAKVVAHGLEVLGARYMRREVGSVAVTMFMPEPAGEPLQDHLAPVIQLHPELALAVAPSSELPLEAA
jgi:hypothetical protein